MPKHLFQPGDVVLHKRYDYRGVVIEGDDECQADEAWYQSNLTQPDKKQPWYKVLVHDTQNTSYVAEENLSLAEDGEPVKHHLVDEFFTSFYQGKYYKDSLN